MYILFLFISRELGSITFTGMKDRFNLDDLGGGGRKLAIFDIEERSWANCYWYYIQ